MVPLLRANPFPGQMESSRPEGRSPGEPGPTRCRAEHRRLPRVCPGRRDERVRLPVSSAFGALGTATEFAPYPRSEEHTSELQSLMRTSYAVFCLKKKKQTI